MCPGGEAKGGGDPRPGSFKPRLPRLDTAVSFRSRGLGSVGKLTFIHLVPAGLYRGPDPRFKMRAIEYRLDGMRLPQT